MTNIIKKNVLESYKEDSVKYALYINRVRSTPNAKDGLKTIHRRVLVTTVLDEKAISKSTKVKSSAIVGTCMKKYHPHGDAATYLAMKPMSNWFEINIPLLTPQGSWGNVQGDEPAAMRYTESRASEFTLDCIMDELKEAKNIVDWVDTYDNKNVEPEYLPVKVPLLLINGSFGIGMGLTSRIPKHNINEVIDATINLIKNPNYEVVLIPDQCMPCEIVDTNFKAISNTGNGSFRVRGIIEIGTYNNKPALFIKSLPDLTYGNTIEEKIEDLVKDKKLPQVVKIHDSCTDFAVNYIIELKKDSDPNFVRDFIYKNTEMEKSITVSFEVIDNSINPPIRMSYKSYLQYFIEFRKMTKFRYYCHKLKQVQTKLHEKDAFIKVLQSNRIEDIVKIIRTENSLDDNRIIEFLIRELNITDLQAQYIINANIKKLSPVYLEKYVNEAMEYEQEINLYMNKITDDSILLNEIIEELEFIKKKYGKPRNCTTILDKAALNNIPKGEFKVVISENNFVKKVPLNSVIGGFKQDDAPKMVMTIDNTDNLLLFDELGRVFKVPVHKLPISDRTSNGVDIRTICNKITSNINSIMSEDKLKELANKKEKLFLTTLTFKGNIKRLDLEDFLSVPPSGILYTKLDADDIVKDISIVSNECDIVVYANNKALRMNLSDIPHSKRNSKGNKAMNKDYVDGLAVITNDTTDILVITEKGKINRIDIHALPIIGRNKAGVSVIKLSKGDNIHSIKSVNRNTDKLVVTTKNNKLEFNVNEIPQGSSISSGTKLLSAKTDTIIRCDIINL